MKPCIVFIVADDVGYGDFGCFGAERIPTPNIDAVAARGMRFTDLHGSGSLCTPSRYSILTGRYCWRTWLKSLVLGGFGAPLIEPGETTVASYLKDHGYRTAAVGKWHLGLSWFTRDGTALETVNRDGWAIDGFEVDYARPIGGGPCAHGFDSWFGIAGSLDMPPYCYIENDRAPSQPTLEKTVYLPQQRRGMQQPGWDDSAVDTVFAEKAVAFIDAHSRSHGGEPFFLYLATSAPHRPCLPPPSMKGSSEAGARGDMVAVYDWVVGRVAEALERNGLTRDTLLMVTSDHGARLTDYNGKDYGHKANGDLRGGKGDIYEGGHRVATVASWPAVIKPGSVCGETLCTGDLLATCAEIVDAGGKAPSGDGRSFLPLLRGERPRQPVHEYLVHHSLDGMFAVRKGPWKLILGLGSGGFSEPARYSHDPLGMRGQLYHLEDDSREFLNRYAGNPQVVEELSEALRTIQRSPGP
jgi:arylsulfatase A